MQPHHYERGVFFDELKLDDASLGNGIVKQMVDNFSVNGDASGFC